MSLQVNFTTHGHDLKAAYESILRPADPKTSNNWAMFGYDKGTNDLKVLGQGDGGLEELEDEFMDGKIQYAFARIIDPNTELNKFILIAWCGDGVPESKKGLFNSHLADGYHLQINARCEADVTPAQILKRVNEGSGSKYSIHKETYEQERIRPLQSAYKRTEIPDIAALQRNPTKPEPAPKYGLAKSFGSTPSTPLPTTTTTSSPAVARSWNAPVVNTPPPVSAVKPVERTWKASGASSYTVPGVTFNKIAPPSSLLNYGNNSTNNSNTSSSSPAPSTVPATRNEPTMNKAQQMRLEREAREKEERERIKREIEASEARDRQAQGQSNTFKEAEEKRLQEEQRQNEQRELEERQRSHDRARDEREAREKEERARADAEEAARSAREEMKAREQAAQEEDQRRQKEQQQRQHEKEEKEAADKLAKQQREEDERRRQEEEEEEERERAAQAAAAAVHTTALVAAGSQVSHAGHEATPDSDSVSAVVLYSYEKAEENEMSLIEGEIVVNVTVLDVGWWSGESVDGTRSGLFPANYVEVIENTQDHAAAAPAAAHYEEDLAAAHHVDAPVSDQHAHAETAAAGSSGPSAVALYDYAAGEPNELSFAEGDVITDIEFVTDDWWNGTSNGASGLFPANYVEMHQ
ncbi:hypothetical protein EC957_001684 [Mortierella hygrophila]|uniref:Drebrin-like protein n=1 Tax=Mortierella hygrophila TaxID=979708 RepID=A0A9P6F4L3_9FUNG|nr:hypothetical protein EC957_001684 [Mortierella hygrophila]